MKLGNLKLLFGKALVVILVFGVGIASSDYFFRIPFGSSTLSSTIYNKVSSLLNISKDETFLFPAEIITSRYNFKMVKKFNVDGTFQIAKIDEENLFVVERFTGAAYIWNISTGRVSDQGNLLIDSGITLSQDKKQIVQIADLHYAFGKLLLSVVSTTKTQNCLFLQALAFEDPLKERKQPKRFFQSPCIEDTLNPALFGGRFTNSKSDIFMSVGEQRYDRSGYPKVSKTALLEQKNPNSVFGSILKFDEKLNSFTIYSNGHRNAQGMFFSMENNKFYESEHGPQGGDEVNIVLSGKNYGWPFVSFGVPYGWQLASGFPDPATVKGTNFEQFLKKSGQLRGTHEGFEKPLFSWYPSVGAGSLLQVPSNSNLKDWRGNLLVVSLANNQLHRLILEGDKVIFDERIDVGARIRDMVTTKEGNLIIALDEGQLLLFAVN